ncbi:MAG: hypothetical protein GTO63_20710 [Anaerolineae bacterium]|nr:hypothetical protein [Anaerolineae bacterium]NIN97200.1 hypothetical protein [Anaerolineae bacterium]NIQ82818.1 hypothetical protein [Anaerolineae bacterium]
MLDSGQEGDTRACEARQQLVEKKEIPYRSAVTSSDLNNKSVVLQLDYGRFSMVLAREIEREGEDGLLPSGQPVDSLVLKVPHHSADHVPTLPFFQAVEPQQPVISAASDNRFGHRGQLTSRRLKNVRTYRIDQCGNIELVTDGGSCLVSVKSLRTALGPPTESRWGALPRPWTSPQYDRSKTRPGFQS